MFANRKIKNQLQKANINENEVSIIIRNFAEIQKTKKLPKETIGIVVHNIINDQEYKAKFLVNPKGLIDEANPQPSP